jgi:hypothetical protein
MSYAPNSVRLLKELSKVSKRWRRDAKNREAYENLLRVLQRQSGNVNVGEKRKKFLEPFL